MRGVEQDDRIAGIGDESKVQLEAIGEDGKDRVHGLRGGHEDVEEGLRGEGNRCFVGGERRWERRCLTLNYISLVISIIAAMVH